VFVKQGLYSPLLSSILMQEEQTNMNVLKGESRAELSGGLRKREKRVSFCHMKEEETGRQ